MGLDITAWEHAEFIPAAELAGAVAAAGVPPAWVSATVTDAGAAEDAGFVQAGVPVGMEASAAGLVLDPLDPGAQVGDIHRGGWYRVSGEHLSFRAGSYSGYNAWRNWLANTFVATSAETIWDRRDEFREAPFFELIAFSDCEGTIGPKAAANLAADFAAGIRALDSLDRSGVDHFAVQLYFEWQAAFDLAADTGIVIFG